MATVVVLDHRDARVAARILELQRVSYRVEADLIGFDQMPPLIEAVEDIVELDLAMLGAADGPEVVGLLGYTRDGLIVDIDRLAVDPTHFRRGIGRMLLSALHHRERDADRFEVSTGAGNEPAIALYRALGYELTRAEPSGGVDLVQLARPG